MQIAASYGRLLARQNRGNCRIQIIALKVFDFAAVAKLRNFRVNRHFRQQSQPLFLCILLCAALAEKRDLLAAIRAENITHVFHQAKNGDIHHLRHLHRFSDDHGNQLLRRGDDDNAV